MPTVPSIRTARNAAKTNGRISSVSCRSKSVSNKLEAEPLRKPVASCLAPHPEADALSESGVPDAPSPRPLDRQRERTLTVKEAAYRLGKSEDAIYKWLRSGRLAGWQPGGRWCSILVLESSVERALLYSFERAGSRDGRSPAA